MAGSSAPKVLTLLIYPYRAVMRGASLMGDVRVFELPDGSWIAEEDVSEDLTIVAEGRTREEALVNLKRARGVSNG